MSTMRPYRKLCTSLEKEIMQIKREIESLPNSLVDLATSQIKSFLKIGEGRDLSSRLSLIVSKLEKVRSQAKGSLENMKLSFSGAEPVEKEKLIDILLDVDALLQDLEEKAKRLGTTTNLKPISAKDLPGTLNFEVVEKDAFQEDINALDTLLRNGRLTQEEYDDKIKNLS